MLLRIASRQNLGILPQVKLHTWVWTYFWIENIWLILGLHMSEKIRLRIDYYLIIEVYQLVFFLWLSSLFLLTAMDTLTKILCSLFVLPVLRLFTILLCGLLDELNCFSLMCDSGKSTESKIICPVECSEIFWTLHGFRPILFALEIPYNFLSSFCVLFDWALSQLFPVFLFLDDLFSCI